MADCPSELRRPSLEKFLFFFSVLGKLKLSLLILGSIGAALLELIGIGLVAPFIAVLGNPGLLESNRWFRSAYEVLGSRNTESFLISMGIVIVICLFFKNLILGLLKFMNFRFSYAAQHIFSSKLVGSYLSRNYLFFTRHDSSLLLRNVTSLTGTLVLGLMIPAINIFADVVLLSAISIGFFIFNPIVTISMFGFLAIVLCGLYLSFRKWTELWGATKNNTSAELFKIVRETFQNIKDVKIYSREEYFLEAFNRRSKILADIEAKFNALGVFPALIVEFLGISTIVLTVVGLIYSGYEIQSILPIISFYVLAGYRIMPSANRIPGSLYSIKLYSHALDLIYNELREMKGEFPFGSARGPLVSEEPRRLPFKDKVVFSRVSFRYPESHSDSLSDVDLEFKSGNFTGIVGSSGAGKSTVADLLLGLLEPKTGAIHVDGVALSPSNIRAWRQNAAYIPQQINLMDDSIRNNVVFGFQSEGHVAESAVWEALKMAKLDDFVRGLPEGLETKIGEAGVRLSGGQRQRIGIARALMRNPELIVMDEATAALDNITEQEIIEEVNRLSKIKTLVVIAHRLSTIKSADRLFLLDRGRLLDSGRYDELVQRSAIFRRMASSKSAESEVGVTA